MNGKGSDPRPMRISREEYRRRWEMVFRGHAPIQWIDVDEAAKVYPPRKARRR